MDNERCPYCQTPYSGDLDENGKPFCDCEESLIVELQAEIERLREALEEIRDLARTGLPPAGWEETYWLFHKSNRIAGMADAALKGQEAEG